MSISRILGAACAAILLSSFGAVVACGGEGTDSEKGEAVTGKVVQSASVSLTLHDASGARIGEGSGILIAPRVVLTAGHLVAGKARWTVTSADGKTKVNGVRGLTYNWMPYNSNKSHPRKTDVGVIYLDRPIELAAYPTLSSQVMASGANARRVRGEGGAFAILPTTLDRIRTFPHAYVTELGAGETLDTGGAVLNDKNEIVGIVSGRGLTSGKLYVARVNQLVGWLSPKVACGKVTTALSTRTYGVPTPKDDCDAGDGGSSGSSGSTGSSGGSGAGSSGGGPDGNCNDGGGGYNSDGTPNGGGAGTGTGTGGSGDGSTNTNTSSSGGGGAGSGTGAGGSGDGSTNTNTSSSGGGGGGAGAGGSDEVCTGENDNPEICPPEPNGTTSPTAGGGTPDDSMDYGGCGTCGSTGQVIVR